MKKLFSVILLCVMLMLVGCSSKTLEYSHGLHFIIAVDNPDATNVDHIESGTYVFDVTNNKFGEAPLYDIYITNEYHANINDLGEVNCTIGGVDSAAKDITLESGQYVYIVSCELLYEAKGHLTVTKK